MEPFEIAISDEVLGDLRQRLGQTRWPDEMPGVGWDYGSNLHYIKDLCEYWRTDFDWRAQEKKLNAFNHYKSEVDGLSIHFILEKGTGPYPMPLVITHDGPARSLRCPRSFRCWPTRGVTAGIPPIPLMWWPRRYPGSGFRRRRRSGGCRCRRLRTCGPS